MNFAHISYRLFSSTVSNRLSSCIAKREFVMSTNPPKTPRRFAPLKEGGDETAERAPKLKGVVFDVDGTLWYVVTTLSSANLVVH
jgi:hypothetical protein